MDKKGYVHFSGMPPHYRLRRGRGPATIHARLPVTRTESGPVMSRSHRMDSTASPNCGKLALSSQRLQTLKSFLVPSITSTTLPPSTRIIRKSKSPQSSRSR